MEFPLNNVTHMHMQNTNRSNSFDQSGSDMCSPTMSGSSPVYGPTVNTAHEQFIDVGSVDRVNPTGGKKKGPKVAKSPQQHDQRRGVSPTNSQPFSPNSIPNPRSRQPVGGKNNGRYASQQQSPTQSAQLASYQQQQMMLAMLGGAMNPAQSGAEYGAGPHGDFGGLTPEEVQHQNLENFAALQASMQMMSYNNDMMMNYFSQIQQQQQQHSGPVHTEEASSPAEAGALPGGFTEYPRRGGSPHHPNNQMQWSEESHMLQQHHHQQNPYQGAYPQHLQQQYNPTQEEMLMMEQEYYATQQQYAPAQEVTAKYPTEQENASNEQPAVEAPAPVSQTPDKKPLQDQPQQTASGKKRPTTEKRPVQRDNNAADADACPCLHCDRAKELEQESPAPAKDEKTPSTRPSARRDDRSDRRSTNPRDNAGRPDRRTRPNEFVPRELFVNEHHNAEPVCIATVKGHFSYKFNGIRCPFDARINDFILFDGDRGVELGEVVAVSEVTDKDRMPMRRGSRHGALARRLANEAEVYTWKTSQVQEAEFATEQAKALAQSLGLDMKVHCTAFQFDCKKLTVFYEAKERVDFRKFLAEMYAKVHCRIWMEDACELGYIPAPKAQE